MTVSLERAQSLIQQCADDLLAGLPPDVDVFDAHTHLGTDIGGMTGELVPLLAMMDGYRISRANVFCLDEPDRQPAFRAANDRTLAFAEQAPGRLVPFARLDLTEEPVAEATRALDRGARGIKLHPRAQRFALDDKRLDPIFALAEERGVPILIHAGLGMPPISAHLHRLVEAYPDARLILAHAGVADLVGLARGLAGRRGVFFDTSAWSAVDLLDLFRYVPPEQIMYASDFPYGQLPGFLLLTVRAARAAGLDDDQLSDVLAGNANRVADGMPLLEPTTPVAPDRLDLPLGVARIHQYTVMAMPLLWERQADRVGLLTLAINACDEQDGSEIAFVRDLLETARELWRSVPELEGTEKRDAARTTFRLTQLADLIAVTA